MGGAKQVLFIANGHGEDSIAAEIIKQLPENMTATAYPMVGPGRAYDGLCEIIGPRFDIPSEGWRHTAGSVARDVKGGMLSSILPARRFLRDQRRKWDKVVAVGDGVSPLMCLLAGLRISIYLDVFKSGYAHRYTRAEKFIIGRTCYVTYCRDTILATSLRMAAINGRSAGNIMVDTVPYGTYDMAGRRSRELAVTLLPGSRATVAESLQVQVEAIGALPEEMQPDLFVALAGGIDPAELARATGYTYTPAKSGVAADRGTLSSGGLTLNLASGVIGNLIEGSDLVLSQAGTATQQALGLGKPVITFDRPDNRRKRMRDEQKLMGEGRILTEPGIAPLTGAVRTLLGDADERARRGEIGRQRLGGAGTLGAVLEELEWGGPPPLYPLAER